MAQRMDNRDDRAQAKIANTDPPIGTMLLLADGRVVACDPVVEQLLGHTAFQIVGTTWFDPIWQTIHPDGTQFEPEDCPAIAFLRTGQPCRQVEMGFYQPSGELVWLYIDTTPLFQPQTPHPYGFVVTMRQSASEPHSDLAQVARDRERILQQEQAAREAAEQANRIKGEFLSVLSNELRSPLNPILGWTKLLQSGKLDAAKTAQALATIERNAKLQTELISDLLVELHGGTVEADSPGEGQGATFTVRLPLSTTRKVQNLEPQK